MPFPEWDYTGSVPPDVRIDYDAAWVVDRTTGEQSTVWQHPDRAVTTPSSDAIARGGSLVVLDGEFTVDGELRRREVDLVRIDLRTGERVVLAKLGTEVRESHLNRYSASMAHEEDDPFRLVAVSDEEVLLSRSSEDLVVLRFDLETGAELGRFMKADYRGRSSSGECAAGWTGLRVLSDGAVMALQDERHGFVDTETGAFDALVPCDQELPRLGDMIEASDIASYVNFDGGAAPVVTEEVTDRVLDLTLMPYPHGGPHWDEGDGDMWWLAGDRFASDGIGATVMVLVRFDLDTRSVEQVWPVAQYEKTWRESINPRVIWSEGRLLIHVYGDGDQQVVVFDPTAGSFETADVDAPPGYGRASFEMRRTLDGQIDVTVIAQTPERRSHRWIAEFDPITATFGELVPLLDRG